MFAIQRILAATMRANGEVQAQTQAKKVASDQMDANQKTKLTIMQGPHGPMVNFSGPADMLNQQQDDDVAKAYATPKMVAETGAQMIEERAKSFGFSPRTSDVRPEDVDTYRERYNARRELGGGVITSAIMSGMGGHTDPALAENLKNRRATENLIRDQKLIQPVIGQELEAGRLDATRDATAEAGKGRRSTILNRVLDPKEAYQPGSDLQSYLDAAGSQLGGFGAGEQQQAERAWSTGRVSFLNDRARALAGEEGSKAVQNYDATNLDGFIRDQVGVDPAALKDNERNRFVSIFAGQQEARRKRESDERRKEEDQRLQVTRESRMEQLALDLKQGRIDSQQANIENKKFNQAQALSKQYDAAVKDYRDMDERLDQIAALAAKGDGAADIALLFQYMKALDPGSVVRESEFKTAGGIGSVFTRLQQTVQTAYNGERLTPANRKAIVDTVATLRSSLNPRREKVKDFYRKKAEGFKIDPSLVGYDMGGSVVSLDDALADIKRKK